MRPAERGVTALWRTTVFRFTTVAAVVVALGVMALLGMIYARTSIELDARADSVLARVRHQLLPSTPEQLPESIGTLLRADTSRSLHVALFSSAGAWVAGNIATIPIALAPDGRARDLPARGGTPELRALAVTTAWGERLIIGRDAGSLREVRAILLRALIGSGLAIAGLGIMIATLLSIHPLRRLRELEGVGRLISGGRLDLRMPVSSRRDELDLFAGVVNTMVGEIARLLDEVRSTTDAVAHDLRTPLTRVRARLHRLTHRSDAPPGVREAAEVAIADLDEVLERFTALLRISELEAQHLHAAFSVVDLTQLVEEAVELYSPLADEKGVRLVATAAATPVRAKGDARLLFEALSNLIDNAIKFSSPAGDVEVAALFDRGPALVIRDRGPGVAAGEREAVLRRFTRGSGTHGTAGHGLGLSLVAAIVRLHHYGLELEDANPGLRVVLRCRNQDEAPAEAAE